MGNGQGGNHGVASREVFLVHTDGTSAASTDDLDSFQEKIRFDCTGTARSCRLGYCNILVFVQIFACFRN